MRSERNLSFPLVTTFGKSIFLSTSLFKTCRSVFSTAKTDKGVAENTIATVKKTAVTLEFNLRFFIL